MPASFTKTSFTTTIYGAITVVKGVYNAVSGADVAVNSDTFTLPQHQIVGAYYVISGANYHASTSVVKIGIQLSVDGGTNWLALPTTWAALTTIGDTAGTRVTGTYIDPTGIDTAALQATHYRFVLTPSTAGDSSACIFTVYLVYSKRAV